MGEAVLTAAQYAAKWSVGMRRSSRDWTPDDYDLYVAGLDGWARMYLDGTWTLEQFEAHADRMREAMFTPDAERHAAVYTGLVHMGLIAGHRSAQP